MIEDIRDYIAACEKAGALQRITAEVDWNLELSHIAKANEEVGGPALLFENVKDHDIPVMTSAFTTRERLAICLEQDPTLPMSGLSRKWMELTTAELVPPTVVNHAPVLENVIEGSDIDVNMFPTPFFYPDDGGRFIGTAHCLVTQDPDSGWTNLGTYRMQLLEGETDVLGLHVVPGKHADMMTKKYQARGEKMPAAVVIGCDPILYLTSTTLVSAETDEYDVAGALRQSPVPVFKSDLTGLTLPAKAEIIIEGYIDYDDKRLEGPLGEFTGYYSATHWPKPCFKVERILHRDKPIFWATTVGKPINDTHMLQSLNRTATLWHDLETMKIPGIEGVYVPAESTGWFWVIVSVRTMYPGHANQVGNAVIATTTGHHGTKGVIVVDHDIAADSWKDVMWALSVRFDPKRSAQIIDRGRASPLDPSLPISERWITSRIIMDATVPYEWDEKPQEIFMDRETMETVSERWDEYGFSIPDPIPGLIDRLTRPAGK